MARLCFVEYFVLCDHFDNMNILAPFGSKSENASFWFPLVAKNYSLRTVATAFLNTHDHTDKMIYDRTRPSVSRSKCVWPTDYTYRHTETSFDLDLVDQGQI